MRDQVPGQPPADAPARRRRGHHEAGIGDVRAQTRLVRLQHGGTDDGRTVDGHPRLSRWRRQPQRLRGRLVGVRIPGVRLAARHHLVPDRPDSGPVRGGGATDRDHFGHGVWFPFHDS